MPAVHPPVVLRTSSGADQDHTIEGPLTKALRDGPQLQLHGFFGPLKRINIGEEEDAVHTLLAVALLERLG